MSIPLNEEDEKYLETTIDAMEKNSTLQFSEMAIINHPVFGILSYLQQQQGNFLIVEVKLNENVDNTTILKQGQDDRYYLVLKYNGPQKKIPLTDPYKQKLINEGVFIIFNEKISYVYDSLKQPVNVLNFPYGINGKRYFNPTIGFGKITFPMNTNQPNIEIEKKIQIEKKEISGEKKTTIDDVKMSDKEEKGGKKKYFDTNGKPSRFEILKLVTDLTRSFYKLKL
jgi:hypothetical protein